MHLLLIIHEPTILEGLRDYFPWESYNIHDISTATTIEEGTDLLKKISFDVILYDIDFPKQAHFSFLHWATAQPIRPSIIVISELPDFTAIQQAIALGVKRFILKQQLRQQLPNALQQLTCSHHPTPLHERVTELHKNETIQAMLHYIDQHYPAISLHEMAEHFQMNSTYVSTFFKTHINKSFSTYIIEKRLAHAATLLQTSTYKIDEISQLIGYANTKHFSQKFRLYYGMTPNQFRRHIIRTI